MIYGVTIDNTAQPVAIFKALAHLPTRSTARFPLSHGARLIGYFRDIYRFAQVADIWITPVPYELITAYQTSAYRMRFKKALKKYHSLSDVFEVGHKSNGLESGTAAAKKAIEAALLAKKCGKKTLLTLQWYDRRHRVGLHTTWRWIEKYIPAPERSLFDYVGVAYSAIESRGIPIDYRCAIDCLADYFPGKLLISECGAPFGTAQEKQGTMRECLSIVPGNPRFEGGWFWSQFSTDCGSVNSELYGHFHKYMRRLYERTHLPSYRDSNRMQDLWLDEKPPRGLQIEGV